MLKELQLLRNMYEAGRRLRMTAPVDDDFPEMMHNFDTCLRLVDEYVSSQPSHRHAITEEQVACVQDMQKTIHKSCVYAGWYSDLHTGEPIHRNFGEVIALMHSELSEALEGWRKDLKDNHLPHRSSIEVEFADCIIRILDTAGSLGLDIGGAIQEKFAYNQTRADHKIENRKKEGGKKI